MIPTQADAEFVCRMEKILELYQEPHDPARPVVGFDERPQPLVSETRQPLPAKPGQPRRYDYEYRREGVANLFFFFAPLEGWRHVQVTARRTKPDFAHCMRELVDVHFPHAESIRVVLDNLNTHEEAALYESFEPAEARRILNRLEFFYTPVHASWLNLAEIEISVLVRQALRGRIPTAERLAQITAAWEMRRNQRRVTADWRFDCDDARAKLKKLYPSIEG